MKYNQDHSAHDNFRKHTTEACAYDVIGMKP